MLFKSIPGNLKLKQELFETISKQRIGHTMLFYGETGCAKLALALAYAQMINCENQQSDDSCGQCSSCLKFSAFLHSDVHFIFPVWKIKNKLSISDSFINEWRTFLKTNKYGNINDWFDFIASENKINQQGKIYKDEADALRQKLVLKNYEARYRVILIWMPENMEQRTSNKLLKTFEEPPLKTVFILVSENPSKLLPTINSRLIKYKVDNFVAEDVEKQFSKHKISIEMATRLNVLTCGDFGKIKQIIKQENTNEKLLETFKFWVRLCYRNNILEASNFVNIIAQHNKKLQKNFLSYAIKIVRDSLIYNFANQSLAQANIEELEFLKNFSPFVHEENSVLIVEELEKAIKSIDRNANFKILFFELSLQMMGFLKVKRKFALK